METLKYYYTSAKEKFIPKPPTVLMIGFNFAGMTTMLQKLREDNQEAPEVRRESTWSIWEEVKALELRGPVNINLLSFHLGGRNPVRVGREVYKISDGILYYISSESHSPGYLPDDSTHKMKLHKLIGDLILDGADTPITVVYSKQEYLPVPNARSVEEIAAYFRSEKELYDGPNMPCTKEQYLEKIRQIPFVGLTNMGKDMSEVKAALEELTTRKKRKEEFDKAKERAEARARKARKDSATRKLIPKVASLDDEYIVADPKDEVLSQWRLSAPFWNACRKLGVLFL